MTTSDAPTLADVVALLHGWFPPETAEDWDAVGLALGVPEQPVRKILFAVSNPDDPDYDPFAEVDKRVEAPKKTGDPQRERLLRALLVVATLGIAFAGFVVKEILEPPPLQVVEHDDGEELIVAPDGVATLEFRYSESNPPEGWDTRPLDLRGEYLAFYEDDCVKVEWLNYRDRAVFLVRGLETGLAQFELFFPISNTRRVFRVSVEGDRLHEQRHDASLDALEKRSAEELRALLAGKIAEGDRYLVAYGDTKEHYLWLALRAYEEAIVAGEALLATSAKAQLALSEADRKHLTEANSKAGETLGRYERARDLLHMRYAQTFAQQKPREQKLKALRSLMRGIGDEGDVQFLRLKHLLEDGERGYGERWSGF